MTAPIPLPSGDGPEVGEFRQGTPGSRWALGRYLVGRSIAGYVDRALYFLAVVILLLGALSWWQVSPWLGVPLILIGLAALAVRAVVGAIVRALTGAGQLGSSENRLQALVADTGADVRRELRRIGLPSRRWTMPLLALRLTGKRRAQTLQKLREFRADNVVPSARVDELHMLLRQSGRLN